MSTILKALRRLEREKSSLEARPLQDEVAAAGPTASRRRFPFVAILAATAALGLGLGGSLWWLWPRAGEAPMVASAPSAPAPVAAQPVAPSEPPVQVAQPMQPEAPPAPVLELPEPAAPVASAPPPEAFASPVAVVERPEPPPALEPAPEPPTSAAAVAAAPDESPPAPGELPPNDSRNRAAQKSSALRPASVARPVEVARAAPPAPAAAPVPRAVSEPTPAAAKSIPASPSQPVHRKPAPEKVVRAYVPDVFVSSTVWHPQKDRRLAKVTFAGGALRELHEGDAIGPLVVSVIEPSGVVFMHDGVELRRRVGAKN